MWRLKRWLYRGLTVLRWLLFPVLMISLLLCMCVPAAADGYFSYSSTLYDSGFNTLVGDSPLSFSLSSDGVYVWSIPSNQLSRAVALEVPFSFTVTSGDYLRLQTTFNGWSHSGFYYVDIYAVTDTKEYVSLGTVHNSYSPSKNSAYLFGVDINKKMSAGGSVVQLRFAFYMVDYSLSTGTDYFSAGNFILQNQPFAVSCGDPNSPNAPAYNKPDGGSVSDLGSAEDSLVSGAQDGIDKAGEAFSSVDTNLAAYINGLLMCSKIMGAAMTKMPWLGTVIEISLALGLFASLLGLAAALIGASDRRAASSARSDQSWKQTQARYGPRFIRRRHK
jgi:hypothetical protein